MISPSFCARTSEHAEEEKWNRKGGKAAEARYEAIASRSVVHKPEDTVCREQGTLFSMGVRVWNRCTFEKAYTCVYASTEVAAFSAVPGVQETLGIHYVELLTPKRLLATIYCSIRSVRRVLLLVNQTLFYSICILYNDTTFFRVFQSFCGEILKRKIICIYMSKIICI